MYFSLYSTTVIDVLMLQRYNATELHLQEE
jgi:hypothetical protein